MKSIIRTILIQKNALCLVLFSILLALPALHAQRSKQQHYDISLGLGLFPTFVKDQGRLVVPPLSATGHYRVASNLSLGLFAGYSSTESRKDMPNNVNPVLFRNRFSAVGLRLAAHTTRFEDWEIYGGFSLGYMHSNIKVLEENMEKLERHTGMRPSSGRVVMSGFIGSRFRLGSHLGIFTEAGFGVSLLQAGLSYRF